MSPLFVPHIELRVLCREKNAIFREVRTEMTMKRLKLSRNTQVENDLRDREMNESASFHSCGGLTDYRRVSDVQKAEYGS